MKPIQKLKSTLEVFPLIIPIILAIIFGVTTFFIDLSYQNDKCGSIPLAFSEISQTKKIYSSIGQEIPALTIYYGVINDITMKVFEANNIAYKRNGSDHNTFASELEFKADSSFKIHHQIDEYAKEFPDIQKNALYDVKAITQIAKQAHAIEITLASIWTADHDDDTRTEYYEDCSTDSKGKRSCHTDSREVYDHTHHTYTCDMAKAQKANADIKAFFETYPFLYIDGIECVINTAGAENEDAMSGTFTKNKQMPSSEEAKSIISKNYKNSTLMVNTPLIHKSYNYAQKNAASYASSITTAQKYYNYKTYRHSDDGPKEFQINNDMQATFYNITQNINEIVNPIAKSNTAVQNLLLSINKYIGIVLDKKEGDASKVRSEVMELAKVLYQDNYKSGLDIKLFSYAELILVTLLLAMIGGGIGTLLIQKVYGVGTSAFVINKFYGRRL